MKPKRVSVSCSHPSVWKRKKKKKKKKKKKEREREREREATHFP